MRGWDYELNFFKFSSVPLPPALIYTQEVQAQEFQQDSNIPLIDHAAALKEAQNQGILIVQDQTQTLSTIKAVDQAYIQQTQELQAATNQYVLEKEKYASDLTNYEAALKEIEKYQQAEENRQKEQEAAQNQYQQELAAYEKEQAQKSFQEKQAQYEKELSLYQEAEKAYQAALAKAQEDSQKEGFLSQAYAQYLIAKSEPNATVRFEGVDAFIGSPHNFVPSLDGIAGTITKLPLTTEATLFKGAGSGTPAGSGDSYGVILEKNKPIRVLYSNLANTSYNGKKITRLDYTYELLSTFAEDGKATAFIYTDPTKTIYGHL